jgi:energy-coupling factor transport system ATP-binding protein
MIKSEKLTFKYEATEEASAALRDVSIEIAEGEFVAILGHNGSGKSTLARHLNALLSPVEGTLWVNGLDTKDPLNTWEIRRSNGMVFQNPDNQIIATVVEEDVAFGPENLGVCPAEIRERVDETLASVGMGAYASHAPHHLSGGQKQRVAIAGVLAMRCGCIVLDEPSAMLDPSGRREVMETITRLNRESKITVILITHFMEEAARADRVIVMDAGEVVMDDVPQVIFSCVEKMRGLGLGVPQVVALAHELRARGVLLRENILTIDEFVSEICEKNFSRSDVNQPEKISPEKKNGEPIIELQNVSHVYGAKSVFEKIALDDVSIKIFKGEIVAIIGHTGSGKSTLIQHFNALLKPSSGVVLIDGESIAKDLKKIRQRVGLVFQYPEHQLFEVTVYKDVAFGPSRMGLSQEEVHAQTVAALDAVGLSQEFYEKSPFELSGGQKRRAAIAGVLAMRPEVLVLDEPAAGLDPRGKEEIFSQIKKMRRELGITVILVSHSMDDAARLTERVLVMNDGKLLCDDTPENIFIRGDFLKSIGLDAPQISRLMARLNEKNSSVPTRIFTVEDAADAIFALVDKAVKK